MYIEHHDIYATGKNKLDVIFVAKRDITVDEEIVWDYGKNYTGVNACVTSCFKCKNVISLCSVIYSFGEQFYVM